MMVKKHMMLFLIISHSDKLEFVKTNAPRVVSGLKMIETYFDHLLQNAESKIDCDFSSLTVVN